MQILTELPELRLHIIEVHDANRRFLTPDDAQGLEPVSAGDENVLVIADNARQWRL